jgi:hypothetical protein
MAFVFVVGNLHLHFGNETKGKLRPFGVSPGANATNLYFLLSARSHD